MKRRLLLSLATLVVSAGLSHSAFADTLIFTLATPSEGALPGQTISYIGSLYAPSSNTNNFYLNGDYYSSPLTLDDSPFLNTPFFLTPGTGYTNVLFNVTVPVGTAIGTYVGTFNIIGGDHSSTTVAASANFSTTVTPEPSSWLLMATGLLGLAFWVRRTRNDAAISGMLS